MARINLPGVAEVWWATTLTLAAPTATQCNNATDFTSWVRGIPSIPETGNMADTSDLSSKFNKRIPASYGGDTLTIEFWSDDLTDTAYTTLARGSVGYWIVAFQGLATASTFAINDEVWAYSCTLITRGMGTPGRDEALWFTSEAAITEVPTERFTIVA